MLVTEGTGAFGRRDDAPAPVVAGIIDSERALHGDRGFEVPSLWVLSDRARVAPIAIVAVAARENGVDAGPAKS